METKRSQPSPPQSNPRGPPLARLPRPLHPPAQIRPQAPLTPPLCIPPPPLPNYCCGNYERFRQLRKKLRIETFSQWKIALQQLLLPQDINERIVSIKLNWYKIKSSVTSFQALQNTLINERASLHYILIQGYNRHHLFTQEELKDDITAIFKKKKRKKIIIICNRRVLCPIQQIWKKYHRAYATQY